MFEFPHVMSKSKSSVWIIKELDQSYLFPIVSTPEWVRERVSGGAFSYWSLRRNLFPCFA